MKRENAIRELKIFSGTTRIRLSANFWEALNMAIKALEQEPKIKVLDRDEIIRKLGAVDIYKASAWITFLNDLEYLELKICEVEE